MPKREEPCRAFRTGRAFFGLAAAAASAAAGIAGCIADGNLIVVAQRGGREQRQTEKLIADVVGKLLTGRDRAEAVGGNENLHIRQHLQHNRYADCQAETVVAQIGTCHTDGAYHALQAVRNDGFIRDGQKHILIYGDDALADILLTATVYKQDIDGYINLAAYTCEARTITQAFHGQITDRTFRGCGAAGFKRDRRHRCRCRRYSLSNIGAAAAAIAAATTVIAAGTCYHCIAGNGHFLIIQLFLLQAAVVHAFHLNANLFLQSIQSTAGDGAGTGAGVAVLIAEEIYLYLPSNIRQIQSVLCSMCSKSVRKAVADTLPAQLHIPSPPTFR